MTRLERLFAIHESLRRAAPRRISAANLAEEFDVSRRTIERDIATLRAAGVPLYAEHGRTGGHISLDRAGNVVVTLSPTEVTALLVALTAAGPEMPFADAGATAIKRILDGLPPTTRLAVEGLRERVRTVAEPRLRNQRRVRRTLETAVSRQVVVNINYIDGEGNSTQRAVDAVGFYCGGDHWHLIGWCHLRTARRLFRLDRVAGARLTTAPIGDHDLDETLGWVPNQTRTP